MANGFGEQFAEGLGEGLSIARQGQALALQERQQEFRERRQKALQAHRARQRAIAEQRFQLQQRQADLALVGDLTKILTNTDLPREAREFMLDELAPTLGVDPKSERFKGLKKVLTNLGADQAQSLSRLLAGIAPSLEPGQAKEFTAAIMRGDITLAQAMEQLQALRQNRLREDVFAPPSEGPRFGNTVSGVPEVTGAEISGVGQPTLRESAPGIFTRSTASQLAGNTPEEFPASVPNETVVPKNRQPNETVVPKGRQPNESIHPKGRQSRPSPVDQAERLEQGAQRLAAAGLRKEAELANKLAKDLRENNQERAKARASVADAEANFDRMIELAEELKVHPGLTDDDNLLGMAPAVGPTIGRLPSFSQPAADFDALVKTLKSRVAFSVLQAMREASKTGGALGNVSNHEIDLLQNNLAALDQTQSPEQFKKSLDDVIAYARGAIKRLRRGFTDTYDEPPTSRQKRREGSSERLRFNPETGQLEEVR